MADTTLQLRDGNNNSFPIKARLEPDGSYAFYHASDSEIVQPDNSAVGMIGTTLSKWSDGFSGPNLAAGQPTLDALTKWNIVRNTGGMTVQQTNSTLVITPGTAVAEFLMVGKTQTTIPQNLTATMSMTVRSANQEIRVGYLEVDSTGAMVNNANLASFPSNYTAILFNGTVSSTVGLETLSGSNPSAKVLSNGSQTTTTTIMDYAIEARPEDVTYQAQTADSTVAKVNAAIRISSMVPNHQVRYAPFIWVRNTGTATANVITIQRILSMDVQELQVEVGGGRGNVAISQSIPVVLVGANAGISSTISNAALSTSTNGNAFAKVVSTTTVTPGTLIKSTAGKIYGGSLTNTGTTAAFLKFYNKTTAPTVGTDVPLFTIPLLPNLPVNLSDILDQYGIYFSSGITYGLTGGYLENDTTALTAGQVIGFFLYV